jgi:hypothetical protein
MTIDRLDFQSDRREEKAIVMEFELIKIRLKGCLNRVFICLRDNLCIYMIIPQHGYYICFLSCTINVL